MNARPTSSADAALFAVLVWLALLIAAVVYVAVYASTVPFADDLELVPYVTGEQPWTFEFFWSQHNEHRVPLPKVLLLPLIALTRDFRAGMYLQIAMLAAVALGQVIAVRRLRGRSEYADAFFPLLWLHWGNPENLLMAFQVTMTLPAVLHGAVLARVAADRSPPQPRAAILMGLSLVAMALCSAAGVALVPAHDSRQGHDRILAQPQRARRPGAVLLASAGAALGMIAVNVLSLEMPADRIHGPFLQSLRVSGHFLGMGLGAAGGVLVPYSMWFVVAACLAAAIALGRALAGWPEERLRAAGILASLASSLLLAATIGYGRGDIPVGGLAQRYVGLPAPALCTVFFAFCLYGSAAVRRFVQYLLFAVACALVAVNVQAAIGFGVIRRIYSNDIHRDVALGLSLEHIAEVHPELLMDAAARTAFLGMLQRAGMPPFVGFPAPADSAAAPETAAEPPRKRSFRFEMFPVRPQVRSEQRALPRRVHGAKALFLFGASELRFPLEPGTTSVYVRFGMHPAHYRNRRSAGVQFAVEIESEGSPPTTLASRFLDPSQRTEDRGLQALDVALPAHSGATLVLRTSPPAEEPEAKDWGFWTDLAIR
jgi:hypothetical protein